jgi:ribonucleoside-diphosphate reductase alpha chain
MAGIMDALAISVSHGLQYGVPLKAYVKMFNSMTFAPSGLTDDEEIRTTSSLVDYIFRRIGKDYLSFDDQLEVGISNLDDMPSENQTTLLEEIEEVVNSKIEEISAPVVQPTSKPAEAKKPAQAAQFAESTAPLCVECGAMTMRSGSCYVCGVCGTTTGCS